MSRNVHKRFRALELVVIICIVCVVAAIGVPTLHARAQAMVLATNVQTLASLVQECEAEGLSVKYRESGQGDPHKHLSCRLETILSDGSCGVYVNPTTDGPGGRVVVNSATPPTDPEAARPAVLITNAAGYQYVLFDTLAESARRALVGTLLVVLDPTARTIDVFSVDSHGYKSTSVVTVPLG